MTFYQGLYSLEKPPEKLVTPTMIDRNFNMRQEQVSYAMNDGTESTMLMWVYDTYRFRDMQEYNDWEVERSRLSLGSTEKAVGEITAMQTEFQAVMMESIAELTMLIAGGSTNV